MKKSGLIGIGILILFSLTQIAMGEEPNMDLNNQPAQGSSERIPIQWDKIRYLPDELMVQLNQPLDRKETGKIFEEFGCRVIKYSKTFDTYHLKIMNNKPVREVVEAFNADPRIKWAEPNTFSNFETPKPVSEEEINEKNL